MAPQQGAQLGKLRSVSGGRHDDESVSTQPLTQQCMLVHAHALSDQRHQSTHRRQRARHGSEALERAVDVALLA
jgi:hypothetical protein